MSEIKEIRARVHFLKTEDGGGRSPIYPGYRPPLFFGPREEGGYDGAFDLEGRDRILPGETRDVRIRFVRPDLVQDLLRPGASFDVWDGRVVGRGTITTLLRDGGEAEAALPERSVEHVA